MDTIERLIEPEDAATVLHCGVRRVQRLIASGELPAVKLGPKITRISPSALEAFIAGGGEKKSAPEVVE
jgi:excisionase family DNA binding protein